MPYTPAPPLEQPLLAVSPPPPPVMFSLPPASPLPLLPVAGPPLSHAPPSPMPPILSSSPPPAYAFWQAMVVMWMALLSSVLGGEGGE